MRHSPGMLEQESNESILSKVVGAEEARRRDPALKTFSATQLLGSGKRGEHNMNLVQQKFPQFRLLHRRDFIQHSIPKPVVLSLQLRQTRHSGSRNSLLHKRRRPFRGCMEQAPRSGTVVYNSLSVELNSGHLVDIDIYLRHRHKLVRCPRVENLRQSPPRIVLDAFVPTLCWNIPNGYVSFFEGIVEFLRIVRLTVRALLPSSA